MLDAGLKGTINSHDPAFFSGYLGAISTGSPPRWI